MEFKGVSGSPGVWDGVNNGESVPVLLFRCFLLSHHCLSCIRECICEA